MDKHKYAKRSKKPRCSNHIIRLAHRSSFAKSTEMQSNPFRDSISSILARDSRYDGQAYFFLKDALDYTLKKMLEAQGGIVRHVSGYELLEGFRDYALEQYGPMASTLIWEWGIREDRDVGNMVFHLIEEKVFGRQESDSIDDFSGVLDLQASLRVPFLPKKN